MDRVGDVGSGASFLGTDSPEQIYTQDLDVDGPSAVDLTRVRETSSIPAERKVVLGEPKRRDM